MGDSGGTTIAHGATEYAVVTCWPLHSLAATLVAQWHAQLTFAPLRPASNVSNAPVLIWPASSLRTERMPESPSITKLYSRPSAVKKPFSSATHSCSRPCGMILSAICDLLASGVKVAPGHRAGQGAPRPASPTPDRSTAECRPAHSGWRAGASRAVAAVAHLAAAGRADLSRHDSAGDWLSSDQAAFSLGT